MSHPADEPTVPDLLILRAREWPNEAALVVAPSDSALTYSQWLARARAVCAQLVSMGVRPGDRVIVVPDTGWLDYAGAYVGTQLAGATPVPVPPSRGLSQLHEIAAATRAVGCLSSLNADELPAGIWVRAAAPTAGTDGPRATSADRHSADVPAEILFTSGTTGLPKGIVVSHASLTRPLTGGDPADHAVRRVVAHVLPPASNGGQSLLVQALSPSPHTVMTMDHFEPGEFLDAVERHRAATVVLAPAFASALLRVGPAGRDLSAVKAVRSTSAPASGGLLSDLSAMFASAAIFNMYTSTEAWPARLRTRFDPQRPRSLGRPTAGTEVRVVDSDGREVPPGTPGDVQLRAAGVPQRQYLDDAERSAAVFLADGWVRTGDTGWMDEEGRFYLADRREDIVNVGGRGVSAAAVRDVLESHRSVQEACVFGVEHPTLGEYVEAAVILVPGESVAAAELAAFAAGHLEQAAAPKRVHVVSEFPRNALGKVLKDQLRDSLRVAERAAHADMVTLQGVVAEAWAKALDIDPATIGPTSSWYELGGSSLEAAAATALIVETTGRLPLERALHLSPTLEEYTRTVAEAPMTTDSPQPLLARRV